MRDKKINRALAKTKGKLFKEKNVERLVFLLGVFYRKMNQISAKVLKKYKGKGVKDEYGERNKNGEVV